MSGANQQNRLVSGDGSARKIGPFPCEWCGKPMLTVKGCRTNEDGTVSIIGRCRGGCGLVWSKPVPVPNKEISRKDASDD